MKEYQNIGIRDVINKVNMQYFLPDIQRPFVWDEDQIYKLFDSLMRGYPIGTFLFWKLEKEKIKELEKNIKFQIKFYKFVNSNKDLPNEELNRDRDEYILVLDGQQRLTALNIALRGYWIAKNLEKKELYFNVLSGNQNDAELIYEFKFLDAGNNTIIQDNKIYINVKRVFEIESTKSESIGKFINEIKKEIKINIPDDNLRDQISDLRNILGNENIITYYPETEADYDRVLEIFIRVNSGGTQLSYSDLLFSKIKLRWSDARDKFNSLLQEINNGNFNFDTDFILKTCLVLFSKRPEDVKYKVENFNNQEINNIKENWSKIEKSIKFAIQNIIYDYISIQTDKMLVSKNAVIPLIYFVYKFNYFKNNDDINLEIKKWLIYSLLTKVFSGQSDTTLYRIKEELDKSASDRYFPMRELLRAGPPKRNLDFIESVKYGSIDSYLVLSLLYGTIIKLKPTYYRNLPQEDHIFPKSILKKLGYNEEDINDIGNIRLITAQKNTYKSDISYTEWITKEATNEEKEYLMPKNPERFTSDKYKDFIKQRKEILTEQIRKIIDTPEDKLPQKIEIITNKEHKKDFKLDIFVTDKIARHYILEVLMESSVPLKRVEIVNECYKKMRDKMKPADMESAKWKPRWEARVRFGVTGLKIEKAIESKQKNAWVITDKGRELLNTTYRLVS